jgi:hypothetical protein
MVQVTVDRENWLRGEGDCRSYLLREEDQKMCCIGFLAKVLGADEGHILQASTLSQVSVNEAREFVWKHESILGDAYQVNDQEGLDDAKREAKLIELGKKMDVEFTFEG